MRSHLHSLASPLFAVLLVACKTDKPADKPAAPPPAPKREPVSGPRPALPVPAQAPAIRRGGAVRVRGAPRREARRAAVADAAECQADDRAQRAGHVGQARESWCTATSDAPEAAKQIAAMLSRDGWSDVTSRSSGDRAAISAVQDGVHIAVTLGGTDAACKGGLATHVIYHGATTTAPALEPGEKVH